MTTMSVWATDAPGRAGLSLREVDKPVPGVGEVLVRVTAVSLNYRDIFLMERGSGTSMSTMPFPFVPGSDMAGVVESVGPDAHRFGRGDKVISVFSPSWVDGKAPPSTARNPGIQSLGGALPGVLAEYVCFPEAWFIKAPGLLDPAQASTLTCAGSTAWSAVAEQGGVGAGQLVLVHGTGGLSLFALQIAQAFGAEVIVVSRSADKLARTKEMGVVHNIDRGGGDWVEAVYQATGDRGVDLVVDTIGGTNVADSIRALAPGGRVAAVGILEGSDFGASVGQLGIRAATITGISVGSRHYLERLVQAVDERGIRPVVDAQYPFSQVHAALDHVERGPFGKVVVDVA